MNEVMLVPGKVAIEVLLSSGILGRLAQFSDTVVRTGCSDEMPGNPLTSNDTLLLQLVLLTATMMSLAPSL